MTMMLHVVPGGMEGRPISGGRLEKAVVFSEKNTSDA